MMFTRQLDERRRWWWGSGGGESWRSTTCGSNQGQELPLCQAALLLTQQSASRWHAGGRQTNAEILWDPSSSKEDQKPVIKRNGRLLVVTLKKDQGWQREECEKQCWRILNLFSSSITQRSNVVTAFNMRDGDKNPCTLLIRHPRVHLELTCSGNVVFDCTSVRSNY